MMARHAAIDRAALSVVAAAMRKLSLSARGYDRVRKVARTIADLAGEDCIRAEHVAEALQFRRLS
jgi:magnesium chelatase family protein